MSSTTRSCWTTSFSKAWGRRHSRPGRIYGSAGGVAHDADDRIIYDTDSGALSYDADGGGDVAAIQFAQLSTNLELRPPTSLSSDARMGRLRRPIRSAAFRGASRESV